MPLPTLMPRNQPETSQFAIWKQLAQFTASAASINVDTNINYGEAGRTQEDEVTATVNLWLGCDSPGRGLQAGAFTPPPPPPPPDRTGGSGSAPGASRDHSQKPEARALSSGPRGCGRNPGHPEPGQATAATPRPPRRLPQNPPPPKRKMPQTHLSLGLLGPVSALGDPWGKTTPMPCTDPGPG